MDIETIRAALRCGQPGCTCHKPTSHVHCPAHEDHRPSLSVSEKHGKVLVKCHAGCDQGAVIEALKARNLWSSSNGDRPQAVKPRIVATYDYHDSAGKLVFQVVRREPKDFRQRRPDGKGGWIWNLDGVTRVPYRLPEVLQAESVFICEGEKDCDQLAALGLTATCNPGGAGKWLKTFNLHFRGKTVVILPDSDSPGMNHALDVARNLHGVAASVRVVELPGLPFKGDVSDWLQAGGTRGQLEALVEAAPEYDQAQAQDEEIPALEADRKRPTQAEQLIKLASDAELFHDFNTKGFATIDVDSHGETWPVRSKGFRSWLLRRFFQATGKAPSAQAMQDALGVLEAQAHFDGPEHEVYVRVAHLDGKIYIDLANESWEAVEITPQGWRVVDTPPVKFRRPRGLAPMPTPQRGGSLTDLRRFINCRNEDWPLVVAWICGAFSSGPYPILILQGEQGAAKTTTAKTLKFLVDPGHSPQRAAPKEIRDLMISAANSWCLSHDNLSGLPSWLSDGFCRLATGGGLSTRELYSDDSEIILDAMRPLVLNGIDSLVNRGDLADRAILLELPPLQDDNRRPEADLWREFEAAQPGILGVIFNSLAAALANVNSVKLARLPRMADFAVWVVAAEPALPWEAGSFLTAYDRNRAAVRDHSLEGDVVAVAVRSFMEHGQEWEGTPTELLNRLTEEAGDLVSRGKAWPKTANSLSNRLRRAAPFLRANGIHYESQRDRKARTIFLEKMGEKTVTTVTTVTPQESCGFPRDDPVTIPVMRDDPGEKTVTLKSRNHAGCDDVTVVTI